MSLPIQFVVFVIILCIMMYLLFFNLFMKIGKGIIGFFKGIQNDIKKGDEE